MIDFKCRPHEVRIFSDSENGENELGDEGADGGNASQNFGARTAPGNSQSLISEKTFLQL